MAQSETFCGVFVCSRSFALNNALTMKNDKNIKLTIHIISLSPEYLFVFSSICLRLVCVSVHFNLLLVVFSVSDETC